MSDIQRENNRKIGKKMESRRIATVKQIDFLLDFLRDNEEVRCGRLRSKEGMLHVKNLWDMCTEEINRFGPPRTAKEWAKYWSDLKSRVRSKVTEIRTEKSVDAEEQAIGKIPALSHFENKIFKILQLDGINNNKPGQEVYLINSGSSSPYSTKTTIVKEEKEENGSDMNVEDFISTVPIIGVAANAASGPSSSVNSSGMKLPASQPPLLAQPRPANVAVSRGLNSVIIPIPISMTRPSKPFTPSAHPVPSEVPSSPKRSKSATASMTPKRRRRRVIPHQVTQCENCTDFKEFSQMLLKLEESHARTAKMQTEAALKMTEVLKMQAEGLINTGAALRDMANNLSRLLEIQFSTSSSTPTM